MPLYDHQIPPGAAAVVHYALEVPPGRRADQSRVHAAVPQVRPRRSCGSRWASGYRIDLPVTTIASDRVIFQIDRPSSTECRAGDPALGALERLRHRPAARGQRPAARRASCARREAPSPKSSGSGRPDGPLNLARVFHKEGRLDDAVGGAGAGARGRRAAVDGRLAHRPGEQGERPSRRGDRELRARARRHVAGDAGARLRLQPRLRRASTSSDRRCSSAPSRSGSRRRRRPGRRCCSEPSAAFERTLAIDSENVVAHYALGLICTASSATANGRRLIARLHARYKPDENARDRAVAHGARWPIRRPTMPRSRS